MAKWEKAEIDGGCRWMHSRYNMAPGVVKVPLDRWIVLSPFQSDVTDTYIENAEKYPTMEAAMLACELEWG